MTPSSNTLDALAQAINQSGAAVNATIVNIGGPSSPDYRLSLQSTALGNVAIQLNDGTQPLLSTIATGAAAEYQIDGQPTTPISSDTSNVTIAPGVTVDLLQTGDTTVTVAPDSIAAANALSSFATAYNAAVTELEQQSRNCRRRADRAEHRVPAGTIAARDLLNYSRRQRQRPKSDRAWG